MFNFPSSDLKQTSQHLPVPFPLGLKVEEKDSTYVQLPFPQQSD